MAVFETTFFSNSLRRVTAMTAIVPVERPAQFTGGDGKPANELFRTLVLLHGFSGMHTDWIRGSSIEQYAMRHQIAVFMPSGENAFYLDDVTRAALYEKFLAEDLIDFVRAVFPLSKKREDTTIGGFSMGGYGALNAGLKHREVYGNIIALSSAILGEGLAQMKPEDNNPIAPYSYYVHTFGDLATYKGSDRDLKTLAKLAAADAPNIYMACGTEDPIATASNRDYSAWLTQNGINHEFKEGPGGHDWGFWNAYIDKALDWLDTKVC